MQSFIGRKKELEVLEKEYRRESGFVVVYGRRRVGKTTLIKEFIKNKKAIYYLATEEIETYAKKHLLNLVADFTDQTYLKNANFDNWEDIFKVFADFESNEKKIIVIDEFQYLIQVNPAFTSVFQRIWDDILKDKNVMLILCGSLISMMTTHVLSYGSPLYGRRTSQIRLQPLRFTELKDWHPDRTFEEQVEFYSITGGVPKYFEFFENGKVTIQGIKDNVLSKSGFLYEEPLFLLRNEVREPINYFSILKAISEGNHKLSRIAGALEQKSNSLSPYLSTLSELYLIEKRVPVTEKTPEKSRKGLYFINDNFIKFWFDYVYPNRGELELDNQQLVIEKFNETFTSSFVSFIYEDICKDIFAQLCREGAINFVPSKIGSYWNKDNSVEIDVVSVDKTNKKIFLAECKYYQDKKVDIGVYKSLVEKCKGQDFEEYEITYGLFSKSGFEDRLVELSLDNPKLILINESSIIRN
ncbi:ATP-binding protein [Tissierella creatinini]|nr:ATP-binding protein [Tissierella creatinini]TJX61085.1 ATP-binding protein [Soehngenia saccharolytica]